MLQATAHPSDAELLNRWQQRFPLSPEPFEELAAELGLADGAAVLARLQALAHQGCLSRIGGIWAPRAAGAGLLCAMAVPPERLEEVAQRVNARVGVNHNYEREHAFNLWFVLTGPDAACLARELDALERECQLPTLRLPMERAYRINLGFDLKTPHGPDCEARLARNQPGVPVAAEDRALAACVEQGLPLVARPYAAWAKAIGWDEARVQATLQRWLEQGSLRRFGLILRHHELGFGANAMCVFNLPDERVDAHAQLLAQQTGVTLCYRRSRAPGWPYNLYCMFHGRERGEVQQWLAQAVEAAGLSGFEQQQLFSRRRFKQCGARYFRAAESATSAESAQRANEEPHHV